MYHRETTHRTILSGTRGTSQKTRSDLRLSCPAAISSAGQPRDKSTARTPLPIGRPEGGEVAWKYNNPAPLEKHIEMGADIKAALAALRALYRHRHYLSKNDVHRISASVNSLELMRSNLEEDMFRAYPELPDGYIAVYYRNSRGR